MRFEHLSAIVRYNYIFAARSFRQLNLGNAEHAVLICLDKLERANQEAISERLGIDKGSVAKTLASLESKGLITRRENPDNRREKLVTLTAEGRAMNEKMGVMLKDWDDALLSGLTKEEIDRFQAISRKIQANAERFLREAALPQSEPHFPENFYK